MLRMRRPRAATWAGVWRLQSLPHPAVFLRRTALTAAGGIDPRYRLTFDFELWTRVAASSKIHVIQTAQAATREHSARISATLRRDVVSELRRFAREALDGDRFGLDDRQRQA